MVWQLHAGSRLEGWQAGVWRGVHWHAQSSSHRVSAALLMVGCKRIHEFP
jgi:hypothetical protein